MPCFVVVMYWSNHAIQVVSLVIDKPVRFNANLRHFLVILFFSSIWLHSLLISLFYSYSLQFFYLVIGYNQNIIRLPLIARNNPHSCNEKENNTIVFLFELHDKRWDICHCITRYVKVCLLLGPLETKLSPPPSPKSESYTAQK